MNFTPIDNNGTVDGFCLIKNLDKKTSSKGDTYLDMTLSDAGGEINAKLWRYNPAVHGEYDVNELVKIRGAWRFSTGLRRLSCTMLCAAVCLCTRYR